MPYITSLYTTVLYGTMVSITMFVCSFIDENGDRYNGTTTLRINGTDVLAINSPKVMNDKLYCRVTINCHKFFVQVLSYGREYYSCSDLQGVLLENEGGSGSARYGYIDNAT